MHAAGPVHRGPVGVCVQENSREWECQRRLQSKVYTAYLEDCYKKRTRSTAQFVLKDYGKYIEVFSY